MYAVWNRVLEDVDKASVNLQKTDQRVPNNEKRKHRPREAIEKYSCSMVANPQNTQSSRNRGALSSSTLVTMSFRYTASYLPRPVVPKPDVYSAITIIGFVDIRL
jgi:hypothetical protein